MKGFLRAGISVYIAVICIILSNFVFGAGGLLAYAELEQYRDSIEYNIYDLNNINSDLILDSNKLIHQTDEIKVQARELGWVEPEEGIIVVKGFNQGKAGYSMGKLMSHSPGDVKNNHTALIIALLAGISFYILSGFLTDFRIRK